jgi:hypothetical protein
MVGLPDMVGVADSMVCGGATLINNYARTEARTLSLAMRY